MKKTLSYHGDELRMLLGVTDMQRLNWVDAAKGLAIIFMIVGHGRVGAHIPYLTKAIYSFHMPLFFIASGMFMRQRSLRESVLKYVRTLLVPYYLTCLVSFGVIMAMSFFRQPIIEGWIGNFAIRVAYTSGSFGSKYLSDIPIIGPLWFLWSMFVASVVWSSFVSGLREWKRFSVIAILVALGWGTARVIQLPFCVQSAMLAILYLEVGHIVAEYHVVSRLSKELVCVSSIVIVLFPLAMRWGGFYCLGWLQLGGEVGFVLSFFLPLVIMAVFYRLDFRILACIGQHTLGILCGHSIYHLYVYFYGNPFSGVVDPRCITGALEMVGFDLAISLVFAVILGKLPFLRRYFR